MYLIQRTSVEMGRSRASCLKLPADSNPLEAETRASSSITVASKGISVAFSFTMLSIACCNRFLSVVESVAI